MNTIIIRTLIKVILNKSIGKVIVPYLTQVALIPIWARPT